MLQGSLSQPDAATENEGNNAKPAGPEVFSFKWTLGPRVIFVEPTEADDDSSFWFKFGG